MAFTYPAAPRSDQVDDYHGRRVADPYRWLEEPEAEHTRTFVDQQNAITLTYLTGLARRDELRERMSELWDFPRTGLPTVRNGVAVWTHNDGLQDQAEFRMAGTAPGPDGARGFDPDTGSPFLDPNAMSEDGAVAVVVTALSPDGRHFAYTVSEAGSDRQTLRVRSTETGDDLSDELRHLRFTSIAWYREGFFYTRWPEVDPTSTEPVRDPTVHYHRLGEDQGDDRVLFHNDDDPEPGYSPIVTHDDRYLLLVEYVGTSLHNGLLYLDLRDLDLDGPRGSDRPNWTRLADPGKALHSFVHHHDGRFLLHTDRDAPRGKVISVALDEPDRPATVVDESDAAIEFVVAGAGELLVSRLEEASHRLDRYDLAGTHRGRIDLPGLGTVAGVSGRFVDDEVFFGYESFVEPPSVLLWRPGTGEGDPDRGRTRVFARPVPPLDPDRVVVERRHAVSTDGRRVGMFVFRLADTELPGPVEMYGYGGFSITLTPTYSPSRLAFLEAGGIVAVTNLRGGTEQGEEWHEQGMFGNKQQVFDDFVACGETLIAQGITTPAGLGIRGESNGGLLTAATMIQRPDLFGAVVSQVPVTDMLRYHLFTAGRYWTAEWGSSDDPEAFEWLIDYSPLHNVGDDAARYPPLLITTAESDDRVVPMHSHKLAAEIQHRAGGSSEGPLLLRVETRAGHGLGKPTSKVIDESADIYAFLLNHLTC